MSKNLLSIDVLAWDVGHRGGVDPVGGVADGEIRQVRQVPQGLKTSHRVVVIAQVQPQGAQLRQAGEGGDVVAWHIAVDVEFRQPRQGNIRWCLTAMRRNLTDSQGYILEKSIFRWKENLLTGTRNTTIRCISTFRAVVRWC